MKNQKENRSHTTGATDDGEVRPGRKTAFEQTPLVHDLLPDSRNRRRPDTCSDTPWPIMGQIAAFVKAVGLEYLSDSSGFAPPAQTHALRLLLSKGVLRALAARAHIFLPRLH